MLSYRHGFHAGNHADVLKHAVLTLILQYLKKKEKPFIYIDTHAGASRYELDSEWALKTKEAAEGIGRLWPKRAQWPVLEPYFNVIEKHNTQETLTVYPGSPEFACQLMRPTDRILLCELHTNEYDVLRHYVGKDHRVSVQNRDGLEALRAFLPPHIRRGLVLIDPSYEIKVDYILVASALIQAHRQWATGIYAVWYPILGKKTDQSRDLIDSLRGAPFGSLLTIELSLKPQAEDWGMNGSGLIIVNAPWMLEQELNQFLPSLCQELSPEASFKLEWIKRPE